ALGLDLSPGDTSATGSWRLEIGQYFRKNSVQPLQALPLACNLKPHITVVRLLYCLDGDVLPFRILRIGSKTDERRRRGWRFVLCQVKEEAFGAPLRSIRFL